MASTTTTEEELESISTRRRRRSRRITLLFIFAIIVSSSAAASLVFFMNFSGGNRVFGSRACDEIYVVGEGETLHTISEKCGDPYIVERNPHIQDPDDVFPGLVIKIDAPTTVSSKYYYF